MSQGSWGLTIIGFAVLGLLLVLQLGIISATFPALFPTQIRYAGFAISYNVSTALFGGTAPFVNDYMIPRTSAYWPAARLIAMHGLRAYDSVQLASGRVARRIDAAFNTFACFDKGLREAAISEGFTLLPE